MIWLRLRLVDFFGFLAFWIDPRREGQQEMVLAPPYASPPPEDTSTSPRRIGVVGLVVDHEDIGTAGDRTLVFAVGIEQRFRIRVSAEEALNFPIDAIVHASIEPRG